MKCDFLDFCELFTQLFSIKKQNDESENSKLPFLIFFDCFGFGKILGLSSKGWIFIAENSIVVVFELSVSTMNFWGPFYF